MTPHDLHRFDLDTLSARRGVKWSRHGAGMLAAWIADMDFPVAAPIVAALEEVIAGQDLGYPPPELTTAVQESFAARWARRYGYAFSVEDVVVLSDVVQAIHLALLTLCEPGDGVLTLTPVYPPFFEAIAATGRRRIDAPLVPGPLGYEIDLDELAKLVERERPRVLLLCNPHNPTGRAFRVEELTALARLACANDLVIVSDEIHADLVLEGATHHPIVGLSEEVARRTVTMTSASKAFNIAGLRCAVTAFGSPALKARFDAVAPAARGAVSLVGMVATLAAWDAGGEWLEAVLTELAIHRQIVASWAARTEGVSHVAPEATYLAWLDLRGSPAARDPATWLRDRARVALSPGEEFGPTGAGHVRLNFATPRPVLEEMLEALAAALGAD